MQGEEKIQKKASHAVPFRSIARSLAVAPPSPFVSRWNTEGQDPSLDTGDQRFKIECIDPNRPCRHGGTFSVDVWTSDAIHASQGLGLGFLSSSNLFLRIRGQTARFPTQVHATVLLSMPCGLRGISKLMPRPPELGIRSSQDRECSATSHNERLCEKGCNWHGCCLSTAPELSLSCSIR